MSQPILYTVKPFDATITYRIQFAYSSSQVFKNRLIVKDNTTNVTVFDETIESRQLFHDIPANTLTNGVQYNAQLSVFDSNNVESALSNAITFYCFATPVFVFSNVTDGQVIHNSYYEFVLSYSQAQNRGLNMYQMFLYNSSKSQIYTTNEIYEVSDLSQMIQNLDNNSNYYIEGNGVTIDGVSISTGLIPFSVEYIMPVVFSKIQVANVPSLGQVQVTSNLLSIDGKSTPENPTYIANERIDLTNYQRELVESEKVIQDGVHLNIANQGADAVSITELKVRGNFKETVTGTKSSTNPSVISGVDKLYTKDDDNRITTYNIPEILYSGDFYDFVTGKLERHIHSYMLTNTGDWELVSTDTTYAKFKCSTEITYPQLCTHFNVSDDDTIESLYVKDSYLYINIAKSSLTSVDLATFKTWLNNNHVTVFYYQVDSIITQYPIQTIDVDEKDIDVYLSDVGNIHLEYNCLYYKSNASVIFDVGFNIEKDFILQMNVGNLITNQPILELSDGRYTLQVNYRESDFSDSNGLVGYFNLKILNGVTVYTIHSEYVTPCSLYGGLYNVWIRKVNNIYEIKPVKLSMTINDFIAKGMTVDTIISENIKVEDFEFGNIA